MLIFLTLLIPLLGGAAMGFIRFPSNKARAIYVESVVCTTSLLVLSLKAKHGINHVLKNLWSCD